MLHAAKLVVKAPVYTPIPRPGGVKLRVGSISWNDWRMAKPRAFIQCKLCGPDSEELAFSGNTSNMRSHLAHCHKPIFSQICEAEDCAEDPSSGFTQRQGALDSVSAPYYAWKRDALHKKYTLPTYKLAVQNIIKLSVDGLSKVRSEIAELKEEGILPSIAGDIWGEGTVSLLGILGYYITKDFVYKQRVLGPIPVGGVRHAGDEIMTATKKACAHVGIGTFSTTLLSSDEDEDTADTVVVLKDTVCESVHTTTSDQGSNIVSGWRDFDGNESTPPWGVTLLLKCQSNSGKPETRPIKDNDTRSGWGGGYKQCLWFKNNQGPIQLYDIENPKHAKNAVDNPDGSKYKDHILLASDWEIIRDSTVLLKIPYNYVQIAQASSATPQSIWYFPWLATSSLD
ncbi:hypothetical protein CYMTET_12597 [Cymbomonas tetramitiformis]|uniref:BED-type domain-containing protein n=1 Tax=Cymbomonas tetramitiformis TaxID=36881 RepID=A0AAE0GK65_9CHLO|nr:hypothetical protein CYMTET_12597 [Cymbomonas tetramitiformis]